MAFHVSMGAGFLGGAVGQGGVAVAFLSAGQTF